MAATLQHYELKLKIADKFHCRHFKIKLHSFLVSVIRDDGLEHSALCEFVLCFFSKTLHLSSVLFSTFWNM